MRTGPQIQAVDRPQPHEPPSIKTLFRIDQLDQSPCPTGTMTTKHLLHFFPQHDSLRSQDLSGGDHNARDVLRQSGRLAATFTQRAGVPIKVIDKKKTFQFITWRKVRMNHFTIRVYSKVILLSNFNSFSAGTEF
ncbi:hypothetical protein DPMN_103208 [Dreissena polymorpha]|uniref:Uncharacterized protein n=1 Tax=Dreissena polymorpha TaxID=45954 RepID=A0A9D4H5P3_DREPO|nr:hypothetical protein DPMN_103208 [Dreissena polymorpha]